MSIRSVISVNLFVSLCIVGLGLPPKSVAQQKTVIDSEYMEGSGRAAGVLSNGDIVIGSHVFTGPNKSFITILNVNSSGQQQWKTELNFREMNSVRSIAVDQNDFIYVLGEQDVHRGQDSVFISKIDKHGKVIWTRVYGQRASYNDASSIKLDRAGNLVFILKRNQVIRLDRDGNILSKQTAMWNSLDVVEFTFDNQNNMIVVGDIDDDIYAMKMDQKGALLKTFSYKGDRKDWAYDLKGYDNGFLILWRSEVAQDKEHKFLARLDNNLQEVWRREYDYGQGISKLGVRNGKEIVMSFYGNGENEGSNLSFLDNLGNSKAVKNCGGYMTGAMTISGEDIIIVGKKNEHAWLVKMK